MSEPRILVWLLLEQDDSVLLGLRKGDEPPFAGMWVLPGEEMPAEESASETVGRFGREQLDIRVMTEEFADTFYMADGGDEYAVNVFKVASYDGRPRFRESGPYSEVQWVSLGDVRDEARYPMPFELRASLIQAAERSNG